MLFCTNFVYFVNLVATGQTGHQSLVIGKAPLKIQVPFTSDQHSIQRVNQGFRIKLLLNLPPEGSATQVCFSPGQRDDFLESFLL